MKTLRLLFAFLTLMTGSCIQESSQVKIISHNQFSLMVPSRMVETHGLNIDATLQYQNVYDDLYLTVNEEPKTIFNNVPKIGEASVFANDINGYTLYHLTYYDEMLDNFRVNTIEQDTVNELPAIIVNANQKVIGVEMYYFIAFIEGRNHYYRIETFTKERLKNNNNDDMLMIIKSFKEANH